MKKFIASLLTTTLLASMVAFAANPVYLTFDDSGFDYAPRAESAPAYLYLARDAKGLVITFSNTDMKAVLPAVVVEEVVDLEEEDFFGDDALATVDDLEEIEVLRTGRAVRGFVVKHEDVTLRDAVAQYTTAFEALDFAGTCVLGSSNIETYTFDSGAEQIRAIFHRVNGGVQVRVQAL